MHYAQEMDARLNRKQKVKTMKRHSRTLVARLMSAGLMLSLFGCGSNLNLNTLTDHYALPLKLSQQIGCSTDSSLIYQVDAQGHFQFMFSQTAAKPVFVTRQLSAEDMAALDQVLENADLASKSSLAPQANPIVQGPVNTASPASGPPSAGPMAAATPVAMMTSAPHPTMNAPMASPMPEDSPVADPIVTTAPLASPVPIAIASPVPAPTGGCQTLDQLSVQHDGQPTVYHHTLNAGDTNSYNTAWNTVRKALDALRDKYGPAPGSGTSPVASYSYALPLKIDVQGECDLPSYTRYALSPDGKFKFAAEVAGPDVKAPAVSERQLNATELKSVQDLLTEIDIARQAVADQPVPDDAPQTMECRSVSVLSLAVNGESRSFDRNSRKLSHAQSYLEAFDKLQNLLQSLQQASPTQG